MTAHDNPSMEELLGVGEGSDLLQLARQRWDMWIEIDDRLAVVDDFDELFGYLRASRTEDADRCLLALAMLAAPDGGDDIAAAATLAQALIPGACILASRLTVQLARRRWYPAGSTERGLVSTRVNEKVASQLWLEIRSFPWRRLTKVGGNILMNTRARVLWECEDRGQIERFERTWAHTSPVGAWGTSDHESEPWSTAALSDGEPDEQSEASDVLLDVLEWACNTAVITDEDRSLLLCLVDAASRTEVRATTRGKANLCSDKVTAMVAPQLGVSPATVRRRAARSVEALAAAAPIGFRREL